MGGNKSQVGVREGRRGKERVGEGAGGRLGGLEGHTEVERVRKGAEEGLDRVGVAGKRVRDKRVLD